MFNTEFFLNHTHQFGKKHLFTLDRTAYDYQMVGKVIRYNVNMV